MTQELYPRRIACLTEETTETLYLLGEQHRIVGISGYTVRPKIARWEKPRISAFTSANIEKILELEPDLVLGFSDLQADIAAALARAGLAVHIFNQRTVAGILEMISVLGGMVGASEKAARLVDKLQHDLAEIVRAAEQRTRRPRVYFEEWKNPLISGIGWVSELIFIAGGEDCFPELAKERAAKGRIIADPLEVVRRAPDIIIGSWCGTRFQPEQVCAREGWRDIPAIRAGHVFEIKSPDILQPGPAALTNGVRSLQAIIDRWTDETR
ncbi:MAG: ABC transporter substrate-binding protein [Alphaproteobacteria bacterium]|nr:ABC transporter substrate-binding protein [Alphaproteobacteria bacterium]MBU6471640.1 ABC transporter substrate-binding protein [Alphaproteobacteria bacterium]MDE2494641.1 ABC transporter substrate-binding protein [Alphaproteobacteria bacterium]